MRILVANGPNLNLLGAREPRMYGKETWAAVEKRLRKVAKGRGVTLEAIQTNHEGTLIDTLQEWSKFQGIILNAGGLSHTSVSLRDTVAAIGIPVVEVHISNIAARETFRQNSLLTAVCKGIISGLGTMGYDLALEFLAETNVPDWFQKA